MTAGSTARRVAATAAAMVVVVALGWAGQRWHTLNDLNADLTLSLTDHTRSVLEALDERVEVTAFLRRDDPARVDAVSLLSRYRREHRRLSFEALDPDDAPGEVRRLGVDPVFGGVAVRMGDRVEVAPTPTEQDVTAALARLLRPRSSRVCWATGHGERSARSSAASGYRRAAELLQVNGYHLEELDLLAGRTVPARCGALVVAAPTAPLGDTAGVLSDYAAGTGRLLLLTDPTALPDPALDTVVGAHGLGVAHGLVLEGDAGSVVPGDPTAPIVRTFARSHPVTRRLAPVFLPGVQAVRVADGPGEEQEGLVVTRLADTTPLAYLETDPLEPHFDEETDVAGPLTVAAAAARSTVDDDAISRSRVVVIGDADFASNTFVGEAANGELLVRSLDWLTGDDHSVVLSTHLPRDRPLRLTAARLTYARALTAGIVPGLFLVAGALVWAVRRSR